jgi:hypothetical protein
VALVTSQHTDPIPVPHEPGATFTFRPLSGVELDEASRKGTKAVLALVEGLGTEAIKTMQALGTNGATAADPRSGYDKDTLVRYGIVDWSYEEPCTPENKAALDARTRDWAAEVILDMNLRPQGEEYASARSTSREESL